jgi:hypothetical protein
MKQLKFLFLFSLIISFLLVVMGLSRSDANQKNEGNIITINENFDEDPGWEGFNNRVQCIDCPTITQNFGWLPTAHVSNRAGEIGGTIWRSTTPAYYAMPTGPFSFQDALSASGKIAVMAPPKEGYGFYVGFFGAERQGWRVWSSFGFRIGRVIDGKALFFLDYKTGEAAGAILNPDIEIPCDGSVHTWKITYEPAAVVKDSWPDPRLPVFLDSSRSLHEDEVFKRAREIDPTITKTYLDSMLFLARDAGLVDDWYRKGTYHVWTLEKEADKYKGRITFYFDDYRPVSYFLLPGHQEAPTRINRFGIYNMQIYHGNMEFYLADLKVNGKRIDLDKDPHWDGLNNRITMVQDDFHARQNFGYTQTNWAGLLPGEIGGRFWGTEVIDPLHAWYAADVGKLTLEDPITFSGQVNFVEGAVDGRMLIGYFNRDARMADISGEYKGNPPHQFLGIEVMDQTRLGYSFTAVCSPRQNIAVENRGPVFIPDRIKRPFSFRYDPAAGKAGRITVQLGKESFTTDLTPEQRKTGSAFDHFGLLNPRKGGKYVDVYFDDISYVARYPENYKPGKFEQKVTRVPYPELGRTY